MQSLVSRVISAVALDDLPQAPAFDLFTRFGTVAPSYKPPTPQCQSSPCSGSLAGSISSLLLGAAGGAAVLAVYLLVAKRR